MYVLSTHALKRFSVRGCIDPLSVRRLLNERLLASIEISEREARKNFMVSSCKKGTKFFRWYEPKIKEFMLGIVVDACLVTVVTENNLTRKRERKLCYAYDRDLD